MGIFSKMLAVSIAMVLFSGVVLAQEAVKAVPGAALLVYSICETVRPLPDAEPITAIVDNSTDFSKRNLSKNAETKKFVDQKLFLVWKGYIAIPKAGRYTFSMSYNVAVKNLNNTILQINGRDFLGISQLKDPLKFNDSKSLLLGKGDYEITIIHRSSHYGGDFSIRMWQTSNPLKKFMITPAAMVHAE